MGRHNFSPTPTFSLIFFTLVTCYFSLFDTILPMLSVKNLTFELNGKALLSNVTFTIGKRQAIGLIGPNGSGKSTLFSLIRKKLTPESGTIDIQNEIVGYVPQELTFDKSILTYGDWKNSILSNAAYHYQLEKTLTQLSFSPQPKDSQTLDSLSEGQKLKLKFAEALVTNPTLILMDEPTNHLDIEGILWLEKLLQNINASVLMISHDRKFLDNIVTRIFEIDEKAIHIFEGNYSDYKDAKNGWVDKRDQQFKAQERKRVQLSKLIENAHRISGGKKRGRAINSAKKRYEREITHNEIDKYKPYEIKGLNVSGSTFSSKLILSVSNLSKTYDKKPVFENISFEIRGQERIWLYGPNGAGKSTFVNIITQDIEPSSGLVRLGDNISWGYFKQNQKHLPLNKTAYEFIKSFLNMAEFQARSFLGNLGFNVEYIDRNLGDMSPGERARLSFGVFTTKEYDFLILDEPTNHLDVWTKEAIEKSLSTYKGSILMISHDRMFVKNVGIHKVLDLKTGILSLV
ncbi:hypothetical protein COY32_02865 [candidate division WWE3 bacterium CG_4_10_14_0_2_um_filter_41_14]|uniref:ABC transporter domain-containing protein n=1 Tax=candidate division WWE3 bacterium CG_4_10_14_0_2_um_filter_41_14 TaxID=1975072 RepID=A0A2M7TJK5_UNCKA|nr:MAG: hypothetical protein COY32_02865 [candidate division WWE3 bacterium CG_4_10_14_0_2_um_filter_41_14]